MGPAKRRQLNDSVPARERSVVGRRTGSVESRGWFSERRASYPQPGWVEHDLDEIWGNVRAIVGELAGRHPDKMKSLACVSLTNQREPSPPHWHGASIMNIGSAA